MKTLGNIIWFVFGLVTALIYFVLGLVYCVTIIFIPVGAKYFKLAGLALLPFKKTVEVNFEEHPKKNAVWLFVSGAMFVWFFHTLIGLILCVTLIGIPFAKQNFKIAKYALRPFGATIEKM